jgi:hypothetical protein
MLTFRRIAMVLPWSESVDDAGPDGNFAGTSSDTPAMVVLFIFGDRRRRIIC